MRYFIIETRNDSDRKYIRGASVRAKYVAEFNLSQMRRQPGRSLAIEAFPTVSAAIDAIANYNDQLPLYYPVA